jgi:hypothetical protein
MFIEVIIFSIIIGYLLRGRLKNLEKCSINNVWMVFAAFIIEFFVVISIEKGILTRGTITLILEILMYSLMFVFAYKNRKNVFIDIMSLGFLLNAIAIFSNGGAMPVSIKAIDIAGMSHNIEREGLYRAANGSTRFFILCDIIHDTFLRKFVVSIGDITAAIGVMGFIICGMKKK